MNTAEPIKRASDLKHFTAYYRKISPHPRNQLMIITGLNTALRISDILVLRWRHVYDFTENRYKNHILLVEKKTRKRTMIYINASVRRALEEYRQAYPDKFTPDQFLFCHSNENVPISRVQAFRIIKNAAKGCRISEVISCHSLRKTFGYHAWKRGAAPALLVNIYNHSTYQVTKRYLGIEQDDRDQIFKEIEL